MNDRNEPQLSRTGTGPWSAGLNHQHHCDDFFHSPPFLLFCFHLETSHVTDPPGEVTKTTNSQNYSRKLTSSSEV